MVQLAVRSGSTIYSFLQSTESKVMVRSSFATNGQHAYKATILISTSPVNPILSFFPSFHRLHSRYSLHPLHQFLMSLLQRVRDNGNCPPSLLGDERNVGDVAFDALISRILDPAVPNSKCVCGILEWRSRLENVFAGFQRLCSSHVLVIVSPIIPQVFR